MFLNRFFILIVLCVEFLFAGVYDKSAIVYYGKDISYPMVGIHDYIIVQPDHINTLRPGFQIYKDKMYAYVSIGEIDTHSRQYEEIHKEWIVAKNKHWKSDVLDIKNKEYQEFLFQKMIDPQLKRGFKNFFFDTLDSYQLYSANKQQRVENEAALAAFINRFHKRYPTSKLIVNRGFEIIDTIHDSIEAVLFESYYKGVGHTKKQPYKDVSDEDRKWFDFWLAKVRSYHKDIISVEYMSPHDIYLSSLPEKIIQKIQAHGMIPYIANKELDIYGKSSKKVIKREIFTLINESRKLDRIDTAAHRNGALVFEYFGYKQHLHDIHKGLPKMKYMHQYAGVVV